MLITVDVGNTDTVFGAWVGRQIKDVSRFSTVIERTPHEWSFWVQNWLDRINHDPKKIQQENAPMSMIYSSVVPLAASSIEEAFVHLGFEFVQPIHLNMNLSIDFDYPNPESLGKDRVANSVAGVRLYGQDLIIVDFGTAITFCVITSSVYRGGVIAPGLQAGLNFLASKTAKLPQLSWQQTDSILGKSTEESILTGSFFGWEGMISHILASLKEEIHNNGIIQKDDELQVIATGGVTNHSLPCDQLFDIVDANLTLRGLNEIFWMNH